MTYPAHQLESEALKTAEERGIDLNPWLLHSKELNRLHSAIGEALTWRQYQSWQRNTPADFRRRFADVARVTKSRKVLAIAAEGLKLVERCEAIADTQALLWGLSSSSKPNNLLGVDTMISQTEARHRQLTARNCFRHNGPECYRKVDPDNCMACALRGSGSGDKRPPNVAGWARIYVESQFAMPRAWLRKFCLELQSENKDYAAALVESIEYFGLPKFVEEGSGYE
ncbi:MAG: hypothetical protein E6R04_04675 [Spirochaetes bacterium]|nr:MAG: hypothetical protein E6R04_04675 [Spirochaetota bacterium]